MASTARETDVGTVLGQSVRQGSSRRFRLDVGKEWILFILFMLPNLALFSLFTFWPMIENVRLSTQRWDMISPVRRGVGSANYQYLLNNGTFHKVLINTAYFTVAAVGLSLLIGLSVAPA